MVRPRRSRSAEGRAFSERRRRRAWTLLHEVEMVVWHLRETDSVGAILDTKVGVAKGPCDRLNGRDGTTSLGTLVPKKW